MDLQMSKNDRRNYLPVSEANWVLSSSLHTEVARFRDRLPCFIYSRIGPAQNLIRYTNEGVFLAVVSVRYARMYMEADSVRRAELWYDLFDDNDELIEELIKHIPRVMQVFLWYQEISAAITERAEDLYEKYKLGVPLMAPTPMEAARIFKARKIDVPPLTSRSHVRLNFYTNPEDGKYYASRNSQPKVPDAWMDLPIDYTTGVDLTVARKAWGLESLAVITKSRSIFNPADEDQLSVLAAYDLSNNFKHPLRVFEPIASPSTLRIRRLRNAIFPVYVFFTTSLRLLVGFPTEDTAPIKAMIGERYERIYTAAGHESRTTRRWIVSFFPVVLLGLLVWLISLWVQLTQRFVMSLSDLPSFFLQERLSDHYLSIIGLAIFWFVLAAPEPTANNQRSSSSARTIL